jgi:hypothetical protein
MSNPIYTRGYGNFTLSQPSRAGETRIFHCNIHG